MLPIITTGMMKAISLSLADLDRFGLDRVYLYDLTNQSFRSVTRFRKLPSDCGGLPLCPSGGVSHAQGKNYEITFRVEDGELRRMSIVRALIGRPDILLANEPTGDLDDENTRLVLEALKECAEAGAAVLLVTHETIPDEYANRIFHMGTGRLEEGPASV